MERSDGGPDTGHDAGHDAGHSDWHRDGGGEVPDAVEVEQREAVWVAWRSLPDESRSLLWRLVVHEEKPHQLAPGLGTTASGVATRGKQARERLRQTLLAELAARSGEPECREVRRRLGRYVRDSLPVTARHHIDEHLDGCARCRAGVLDVVDVDAAIRLRVAPVLLPGAFTPVEEASVPVPVGVFPGMDGADLAAVDADAPAAEPSVPDRDTRGRVLSVPVRSAAAVLAAAALLVVGALFLLRLEPTGRVSAGAPGAPVVPGSSMATADGAEAPDPTRGTSVETSAPAPRPVIGVATAVGVSRYQSSGGRTGSGRPAVDTAYLTSAAGPSGTSVPTPPTNPSTTVSSPVSSTSTPSRTASAVGTVTSLRLAPSDHGYLAHLAAPPGWLITSVQSVHGTRVREHVGAPTPEFDGRLAGDLVVEVTRVRPDLTGALTALFTGRSGTLPGSGDYPLR